MSASGELGRSLADAPREPFRVGTAWDPTPWTPQEGIASLGIRAAVFEVGEERTAYVVVDGNNVVPGLRDRMVEAVVGAEGVDDVEVMTTDNHAVTSVESENMVGSKVPHDELIERVRAVVEGAIDDLEPVEGGMAVEHAEVTVFGSDRTESLASHANAVLSMGGGLVATVVLAAMAISVLIFFLA
jgi:putative membrane protein